MIEFGSRCRRIKAVSDRNKARVEVGGRGERKKKTFWDVFGTLEPNAGADMLTSAERGSTLLLPAGLGAESGGGGTLGGVKIFLWQSGRR